MNIKSKLGGIFEEKQLINMLNRMKPSSLGDMIMIYGKIYKRVKRLKLKR